MANKTNVTPPIGAHTPQPTSRDTQQLDLLTSAARARSADPVTSKQAAASVRGMSASHKRILAMFERYGDMTDETLAQLLDDAAGYGLAPRMSPSGVRSRRSDLSKPNMERLSEIGEEYRTVTGASLEDDQIAAAARHQLRIEGFRSKLWDTGKRAAISTGRQAIVWGIAR